MKASFLLVTAMFMVSCGGAGTVELRQVPSVTQQAAAQNWQISLLPGVSGKGEVAIGGSFGASGGIVIEGACFDLSSPRGVSSSGGTEFGINSLAAPDSQAVSLVGTYSDASRTMASGTYAFSGGCSDGAKGTWTGSVVSEPLGDWILTLNSVSGTSGSAEIKITGVVPASNRDPLPTLRGTGSADCLVGAVGVGGYIAGDFVIAQFDDNFHDEVTVQFLAAGSSGSGYYQVTGGSCNGDNGTVAAVQK